VCHHIKHLFLLQLVGGTRASKAVNPLNKESEKAVEKPNKILTNTIEQALMFIPSTFILTSYLDQEQYRNSPTFFYWSLASKIVDIYPQWLWEQIVNPIERRFVRKIARVDGPLVWEHGNPVTMCEHAKGQPTSRCRGSCRKYSHWARVLLVFSLVGKQAPLLTLDIVILTAGG
jgi:hypothetical protein